jgi:hypothetical protein
MDDVTYDQLLLVCETSSNRVAFRSGGVGLVGRGIGHGEAAGRACATGQHDIGWLWSPGGPHASCLKGVRTPGPVSVISRR